MKDCESCGMLNKHLNIQHLNKFIGDRWWYHDWVWKGPPSKGSVIHKQVWDKIHHFVKHVIYIYNDGRKWAREPFVKLLAVNTVGLLDYILFLIYVF